MTNLTNLDPAASYGDLLTLNNGGTGIASALSAVQDGFGNNSSLQLSKTAAAVVGGLSVIGDFAVTGNSSVAGVMHLSRLAADPATTTSAMYYNTVTNTVRVYIESGLLMGWRTVTVV